MHKLSPLAIGIAILLAGCATPQKSHTWETVRAVRHSGPASKAPTLEYAKELHKALQDARVEHKLVTFKFRYRSRLLLNREGEETAVIYRDSATCAHPWWLMAERLSAPIWLPTPAWLSTPPVASQVAFYVRRPATVVKVADFPAKAARKHSCAGKDGKSAVQPVSHAAKSKRK